MSSMSASHFSLDPAANDSSVTLDFLRHLGAQAVCVGHALNFFDIAAGLRPPYFPYMQNLGVMVFFVLSGFVIAHALVRGLARERFGLGSFVVERVARIYSAYLPALLLIAALDGTLLLAGRFEFANYFNLTTFLGNVLMLQNYPGPFRGALAVPAFGSAGQLWSLAVEFHIYLFVGAAFFFTIGRGWRWALLVMLLSAATPFAFFSEQSRGIPGTGLFVLWLMGFAGYFMAYNGLGSRLPLPVLASGAVVTCALWMMKTVPGQEYRIESYFFAATAFLFLVAATQRTRFLTAAAPLRAGIRFAANYSFSLYLVHYSILYFLKAYWTGGPGQGALIGVLLSNVVAIPLAYFTEFRHRDLARWLDGMLARLRPAAGLVGIGARHE